MTSQLAVKVQAWKENPLGIIEDYHYEKKGGSKILKDRDKKVKNGGWLLKEDSQRKEKEKEWLIIKESDNVLMFRK